MKYKHLFTLVRSTIVVLSTMLFLVNFSCNKKEETTPEQLIKEPIRISTSDFSELTSNQVRLFGEVNFLNEENIIDAGFVLSRTEGSGEFGVEKEFSIGKNLTEGEVEFLYTSSEKFEQNITYRYFFYVRTNKNYYKGLYKSFVLNNINVHEVKKLYSYGLDTVKIVGDFSGFDDNYRLDATGGFYLYNIPYSLNPGKNELEFVIKHSKNPLNREGINVSIVRKGEDVLNYNHRVATIEFVPRLEIKKFSETPYSFVEFSSNNLGELADRDSRLKIIINDIELPYERFVSFFNIENLKGTTYKIGFKNAKETVFIPITYELKKPDNIIAEMSRNVVHPSDTYKLQSDQFFHYFFSNEAKAKLGNYDVYSYYDQWDVSLFISHVNIPPGTYDFTVKDRFYNYTYPHKIVVEELAWTTIDKGSAYYGEIITAKGNFIEGNNYLVFDQSNNMLGQYVAKDKALQFDVGNQFENVMQIKIGYQTNTGEAKIISQSKSFLSNGFTFDNFYPKRGMVGDILTIEGKGIAYASEFLLGDQKLTPIIINKNKVTFSIPMINGSGNLRINYIMNNKHYQANEYFEIYIPD